MHLTVQFINTDLPNISTIQETNIKNRFVKLIGNIFLDDDSPGLLEVFWTKNGKKIDIKGSGGRLSEVTIDDPSLIIREVCHHDAGPYQLTATNAVGPTKSDEIVLGNIKTFFTTSSKADELRFPLYKNQRITNKSKCVTVCLISVTVKANSTMVYIPFTTWINKLTKIRFKGAWPQFWLKFITDFNVYKTFLTDN